MSFFKKHIKADYMANRRDRVAAGIAGLILKVQVWFAVFLGARTGSWKRLHQQFFLLGIVLCFGGLSMVPIIRAFSKHNDISSFRQQSITVPAKVNKPIWALLITDDEYRKVQDFKTGHPGLAKDNPRLYDSLLLIEDAYNMQGRK